MKITLATARRLMIRSLGLDGAWKLPKGKEGSAVAVERLAWAMGQERPPRPADRVPGFPQIDDTHPNQDEAAVWWKAFVGVLDAWWQGQPAGGSVAEHVARRLGEPTPVKRWLVRLLRRKLRFCASYEEGLDRLIHPKPGRTTRDAARAGLNASPAVPSPAGEGVVSDGSIES